MSSVRPVPGLEQAEDPTGQLRLSPWDRRTKQEYSRGRPDLALLAESADELVRLVEEALHGSDQNDERTHRAVEAYFTFVADNGQAYRLIFESDLRGQVQVEEIVDRATDACIAAITRTITTDTGVDPERARLLAAALVGLSQVSARYWLTQSPGVPRAEAIEMLSTLAWRGISRFPRHT